MWRVAAALLLLLAPAHAEYISGTGGGGGGGSGTVTSISAGCGSTTGGSAITTSGTIASTETVSLQTGTNYAILSTDCGKLINLSNASPQTPTIARATTAGFTSGTYWDVCNIGAGTQTLTPTTSTIGGNASQVINQGQCIRVVSDGTNYQLDLPAPGLTSAGAVLAPVGALGTPGFTFSGATTKGLFETAAGVWIGTDVNYSWLFSSANSTLTSFFNASARGQIQFQGGTGNDVAVVVGAGNSFEISAGAGATYLGAPVGASLQLGQPDAATAVAQTLRVQSVVTGTTNTAGANFAFIGSQGTGTGAGGNISFNVSKTGSTGSTVNTAFPLLTLNAGAAATATVQFGDGSNFTTYDTCSALTTSATGVIACTASAMRFKNPLGSIAAASLADLHPASWTYKEPDRFGKGEHVGLYADDVVKMDPRCAVYDSSGELKNYEDRCLIAHLVAVVQQQQRDIEQLKRRR